MTTEPDCYEDCQEHRTCRESRTIRTVDRMERLLKTYVGGITVSFSLGDDELLASDEVSLWAGDAMCPHIHRYDPITGHGWSSVSTGWEENDTGLATLIRALDEMEIISTEEYECEKCHD